ncbi:NAD(P)/FAD-dependent oxidoreductase [Limibacillus halophilus]|uniref:L-2-hydroxyglutarate oxidase LhgO n=1 Tax=Limibacillus halophilus TaxID=1579333 RepID=A0A839SQY6_9PROT|nr:NAD(P)/FAD-dependent oxidoreductase [Limibacillus halophilus]MBB3064150.1 L-2-hydroxyglutarate oxidase LhgO [Limibacillus halophilus]
MEKVEVVVIGAGVIGLAIAEALAATGREVVVVERANCIGSETSSRNSEVIHAGLYYPPGSLKARLCVAGKKMLYTYCERHGVGYRRCEKLVVASADDQLPALDAIARRATENGVETQRLTADEAKSLEPELETVGALLSPSTGIINSHDLMLSLQGGLEDSGGFLAFNTPVMDIALSEDGHTVRTGGAEPMTLKTSILVNAAGLYAEQIARKMAGLDPRHVAHQRFARGCYFTLQGRSPFSRLVYPMPEAGVLGIHLTLDLAGRPRFGPDIEWIDEPDDYRLDPSRATKFYESVRKYWPALPDGALEPGYSGIRPKIHAPGEAVPDFRIDGPAHHGIAGLVNLFGMESPGLTSSLAIGEYVCQLLRR